ncbi:MAG: PaaX family transcriptional regulator C-terminal domain-containing protein [Planctomycetota bacterium]
MMFRTEPFGYDDLLVCLAALRRYAAMEPLAYLIDLVGYAIVDRDLKEMVNYLVRRKRVARKGRGATGSLELLAVTSSDDIVESKMRRSSAKWDGSWNFLTYDIPVSHNLIRRRLVRSLHDMGFAMMSASTWISPYNWADVFETMFAKWDCGGVISHIRAGRVLPLVGDHSAYPVNLWDHGDVRHRYRTILERCKHSLAADGPRAERNRAQTVLQTTKQLKQVQQLDPMLPRQLLPRDWPRDEALAAYKLLQERFTSDIAAVIGR